MKDRKINVDRPQLKANEILSSKNFDAVVRNHQFMSKPFYKQTWFFGTAGLASLGLIIGGTLAFQKSVDEPDLTKIMTDAPPNLTIASTGFLVSNTEANEVVKDLTEETIQINLENTPPIEKTFTSNKPKNTQVITAIEEVVEKVENKEEIPPVTEEELDIVDMLPEIKAEKPIDKSNKTGKAFLDMSPRISDKLGGTISRNELFDNKGITTEGDISIIHFELHVIDGLGGKVFEEEGNQLNTDMKDALQKVGQGETIYFENIRGKVKNGSEVRLNPLRYVLMN